MLILPIMMVAQVGVNTKSPQAKIEIVSSNQGVLIPRLALSSTDISSPVISPDEAELIFNTHTTTILEVLDEDKKVTKGFYFWENSKWNRVGDDIKMPRYAFEFSTNGFELRPNRTNGNSVGDWQDLTWDNGTAGGISTIGFKAPNKGVYQIILAGNYGLGHADESGLHIHTYEMAVGEGVFRIRIDVNSVFFENVDMAVNSFSIQSSSRYSSGTSYYDLPKHTMIIKNISLEAGDLCELTVKFDEIRLDNVRSNPDGNSWIGDNANSEYNNKIQVQLIGK